MQNATTPQKPTTPLVKINDQNLHEYTDEDGNISFPGAVVFEGDLTCEGKLTCMFGDNYDDRLTTTILAGWV